MPKVKSMGVTLFGWLLIVYFLYTLGYPIVYSIYSLLNTGADNIPGGPLGSYHFLKRIGVNSILLGILNTAGIIQIVVSICSIIGGIGVLKLKIWARKFVLIVFSISFVSLVVSLSIQLFEPTLAKALLSRRFGLLMYAIFIPLNGLIISFSQHSGVVERFKNNEASIT